MNLCISFGIGQHQGGVAVFVLGVNVDVGLGDERFDDLGVSMESGQYQGCDAVFVLGVNVDVGLGDERFDGLGATIVGCTK